MKLRFHIDNDGSEQIVEYDSPEGEAPVIPRLAEYVIVSSRGPLVVKKIIWSECGSVVDLHVEP